MTNTGPGTNECRETSISGNRKNGRTVRLRMSPRPHCRQFGETQMNSDDEIVTETTGNHVCTRRGALGFAGAAATALAFANFCQEVAVAADNKAEVIDPESVDFRYAPQFYIGDPNAAIHIEVAWSIQCSYTLSLVRERLGAWTNRVLRRNDAYVVFHHLCRHKKEVKFSETLLSVDPTRYGAACLAAMQYYASRKKFPSHWNFKQTVKKMKLPKDPEFDKKAARKTSILLNAYLAQDQYVTETPSVYWNGKWEVGAGPDTLARILEESGYEG